MDIAAFDAWRKHYDQMSYQDQMKFYDLMEADHPVQSGFTVNGALTGLIGFFGEIVNRLDKVYILELGGWKGELAQEMLNRFPSISIWCNVEICRAAVQKSVFQSARYSTLIPYDFVWKVELPPANVLVASHFIEHIRARELAQLLGNIPAVNYIALVAPLPDKGPVDWTGYHGSHILEVGWSEVDDMLAAWGYEVFQEFGDMRAYQK